MRYGTELRLIQMLELLSAAKSYDCRQMTKSASFHPAMRKRDSMRSTQYVDNRAGWRFCGARALVTVLGCVPVVAAVVVGVASASPMPAVDVIPVAPLPAEPAAVRSVIVSYQSPQIRNSADAERPIPDHRYLAPVRWMHLPWLVASVAPIAAPKGKIRIGYLMVDTPACLTDDQVAPINGAAANVEAQIATFGDSIGLDPSRSDLLAANVVTDAAIGASVVGSTIALPMLASGALMGALNGLVMGIGMLPFGLVAGPVAGAVVGAAVSAGPVTLAGAALGAAVGATQALSAPPNVTRRGTPLPNRPVLQPLTAPLS